MKIKLFLAVIIFSPLLSKAQQKPNGKAIYTQRCMTCHQVDGTGAQNMIPPLIKTEYVLGDKTTLIKILLNGLSGEIKVNGDVYAGEMPSQAFLKDSEIAAVLSYVRNSFGNKAGLVTNAEVRKSRAANKKVID
ncbi:c-type cytochrome [Mucilaginibacter myungsuensis]|uniref:Cytochrome c n=1 Tax=Mucilaginibacter myungsuensis TaxID=649104 RepID=A0A929KYU0_9SPHI|nr:cytochrome c [Mucilaginibacter myungsuensis]MBE9662968.1 cytochrome c [Mucilaginibacter myungsuensis]MDN3598596.1 cytochrome c [Mucilaginibacter myungsuensis]